MSGALIKAMLSIILTWIFLLVVFTGFGFLIRRCFRLKIQELEDLLMSFWTGWACTVFFLQIWNFWFRIDWCAFVLVSVAGITGLVLESRDLRRLIKANLPENRFFCFIMILVAIWLANRAILPPLNWDSGVYHLSSVRWAATFPVVPGLGNLHGLLAYNSSYFLYVAMLETGPWAHRSYHIANGVLLFVLLAQIFSSGLRIFKRNSKSWLYDFYNVLLLAPVLKKGMGGNLSSPSPDLPVFILGIVLSSRLLAFLADSRFIRKNAGYTMFCIAAITALGITIKLSFFALGGVTLILVFFMWFSGSRREHRSEDMRTLAGVAAILAIAMIPWMARGVILSGYIAYPFPFGFFPVEWRVPQPSVVNMGYFIRGIARTPPGVEIDWEKGLSGWKWLKPWAASTFRNFDVVIPAFLALLGFFLAALSGMIRRDHCRLKGAVWLFFLPAVASIVYWFITAPAARFADTSFWILGAGSITVAVGCFDRTGTRNFARACVIFLVSFILCTGFLSAVGGKKDLVKSIISSNSITESFRYLHINKDFVVRSGEDRGFHGIPDIKVEKFVTRSGLIINVPKGTKRCWDAPLPCTPFPDARLRLRRKGDMRYGFMIYPRDESDPTVGMSSDRPYHYRSDRGSHF